MQDWYVVTVKWDVTRQNPCWMPESFIASWNEECGAGSVDQALCLDLSGIVSFLTSVFRILLLIKSNSTASRWSSWYSSGAAQLQLPSSFTPSGCCCLWRSCHDMALCFVSACSAIRSDPIMTRGIVTVKSEPTLELITEDVSDDFSLYSNWVLLPCIQRVFTCISVHSRAGLLNLWNSRNPLSVLRARKDWQNIESSIFIFEGFSLQDVMQNSVLLWSIILFFSE